MGILVYTQARRVSDTTSSPLKTSLESLPTLDDGKTETTLCSDPVEEHVHGK